MKYEPVKRNRYFNPEESREFQHFSRNHYQDIEEFHRPLGRMHHAHVHDWGIARGLEVNGTIGEPKISVNPGVAIDSDGELIVLSRLGDIGSNPAGGESQEEQVPVPLDLSDSDGQTRYVTIQFSENMRLSEGAGGRFEQVPWLRLQTADAYVDDGSSILLAIVVVDADGKLAELKVRNSELNHRRRLLGETIEKLQLQRSVQEGNQIKEVPAGKIAPIEGGLQISVPKESDRIMLAKEGEGKFADLDVRAKKVTIDGSLGLGTTEPTEKLVIDSGPNKEEVSFLFRSASTNTDPQTWDAIRLKAGWHDTNSNAWGVQRLSIQGMTGSGWNELMTIQGSGSIGIGTTAPVQKFQVSNGNAIINNAFLGDVGHGSTWAGFSHSSSANTTGYGLLQQNDGKFTLINKKSGGGFIGFRVDNADKMVIDDKGKVGIGTSSPQNLLHVFGTGPVTIENPNNTEADILFKCGNNQSWQVGTNSGGWYVWDNAFRLVVKPGGNIGIGTTTPAFKLDVAGAAHASSFPTSSDMRLKANVAPLTNVLEKLDKIQGISFDWNEAYESLGRSTGHREIGVTAQEVEAVFPELVTTWGDENYKAVDYGRLTSVLIEAIKELKTKNEDLQQRLQTLEKASDPT